MSFRATLLRFSLALVPAVAAADVTSYTNSADFENVLNPGYYTEEFSGTPVSDIYSSGDFTYEASATGFGVYKSGTFISTQLPENTITITFTSGNVTAFGGNFWPSNAGGALISGASLSIEFSDGTTQSVTVTPSSTGAFYGFTSDGPAFVSFSLSEASGNSVGKPFPAVDLLTVGTVASTVPETTSVVLSMGAAGFFLSRRRRNR